MKHSILGTVLIGAFGLANLAHADDINFHLVNKTGSTITSFHIAHASTNAWGGNRAGDRGLSTGEEINTVVKDDSSFCTFDIMAEFANGETLEDAGLDFCDFTDYRISEAGSDKFITDRSKDLLFDIQNFSEFDVVSVSLSRAGMDDWGNNFLDSEGLESGYQSSADIDNGRDICTYDVRVDYVDQEEPTILADIDLCESGKLPINDPAPVHPTNLEIKLVNRSFFDVREVLIGKAIPEHWVRNYAEGGYLVSGAEIDRTILDGKQVCVFDIKTKFENGNENLRYAVNLCKNSEFVIGG